MALRAVAAAAAAARRAAPRALVRASSSSSSSSPPGPSFSSSLVGASALERGADGLQRVVSADRYGFNVSGVFMRGSVVVFRDFTLLWDCARVADASPRNLAVVHAVRPRPDLLLLGTGEDMRNVNPALYAYFARAGVAVEPMATPHAIALFNTLTAEGRRVAASGV
jgi:uncharacterized protein